MKIIIISVVVITILSFFIFIRIKHNKKSPIKEMVDCHVVVDDRLIESGDIYKIIEPVWWSVSIYDGKEKYNEELSRFSKPQKYVFAILWYESEVNNGGHDQFYFNSTGIVWEDAMQGLKEVGLNKAYDIIKESAHRFGGYPDKDRIKRQEKMELSNLKFDDLDDKFYKINGFDKIIINYIKNNKKSFYFEGIIKKPIGFDK